jgi:dihydropteroate synthase
MRIGNREFNMMNNDVYIMGILNVTPDSFSDGSKFNTLDKALYRVEEMIKEGSSIIDVGGESTRPGYNQIDENEEIERVVAIIRAIKDRFDIPVSIDTYKAEVALESFMAGADMVNDIWGFLYEEKEEVNLIAKYTKDYNKSVCLMHNDRQHMRENNMDILIDRLNKSVNEAIKYNIDKDRIMIDPGIGFAKSYENNLYVMKNIDKLHCLGYPILLGTSRKSMIGNAIGEDVNNRVEGTLATTVYGMEKGIRFVRVHDVKENKRAIDMMKAIMDID